MARIALDEVTKKIYEVLSSASVGWSTPASVYDEVPQNATMPYVELGNFTDQNEGTKTTIYSENTQTINVYSDQPGARELSDIMNQTVTALSGSALEGDIDDDFRIVLSRHEFAEAFKARDPQSGTPYRVGALRIRLKVEDKLT